MSILADLSSGAVGGLLGGIGQLARDIREAIVGKEIDPAKAAEISVKITEMENALILAQTTINLKEAESERLFVCGWRPFVGWLCGFALGYAAILEPLLTWCARVYGFTLPLPSVDTSITLQVLMGLLGLGALRSIDKSQSPAPKGKE